MKSQLSELRGKFQAELVRGCVCQTERYRSVLLQYHTPRRSCCALFHPFPC